MIYSQVLTLEKQIIYAITTDNQYYTYYNIGERKGEINRISRIDSCHIIFHVIVYLMHCLVSSIRSVFWLHWLEHALLHGIGAKRSWVPHNFDGFCFLIVLPFLFHQIVFWLHWLEHALLQSSCVELVRLHEVILVISCF